MKFKPLLDRVVVKRIDELNRTAGGIIIPDTAKEKPSQGVVVAVGPGGLNEDGKMTVMTLKEGDKVLFGKWSGTEVKIDGEEYVIEEVGVRMKGDLSRKDFYGDDGYINAVHFKLSFDETFDKVDVAQS